MQLHTVYQFGRRSSLLIISVANGTVSIEIHWGINRERKELHLNIHLFALKYEPLLRWWYTFLFLQQLFNPVDRIFAVQFNCDLFACQSLYFDYHEEPKFKASLQIQAQAQRRLYIQLSLPI